MCTYAFGVLIVTVLNHVLYIRPCRHRIRKEKCITLLKVCFYMKQPYRLPSCICAVQCIEQGLV